MEAFNRRREDDFMYKVSKIVIMVGALGALGGAFFWLGNTKWVDRAEYDAKCERTESNIAIADKTIAVMQTDLLYIKQGVDRINQKLDRQ